jgi:hypothetical protein
VEEAETQSLFRYKKEKGEGKKIRTEIRFSLVNERRRSAAVAYEFSAVERKGKQSATFVDREYKVVSSRSKVNVCIIGEYLVVVVSRLLLARSLGLRKVLLAITP